MAAAIALLPASEMRYEHSSRAPGQNTKSMDSIAHLHRRLFVVLGMASLIPLGSPIALSQPVGSESGLGEVRIVQIQGKVEIRPRGASTWVSTTDTNQVLHPSDRLRSGENSRGVLRLSADSIVPFGPLTEIEIRPPLDPSSLHGLHVIRGIISFVHRDKPGRIGISTAGATAGILGTEFVLSEDFTNGIERTVLSLIEGKVEFENTQGSIAMSSGDQAVAEPGKLPRLAPGFVANNLLQWCFYYPAIVDPADLRLSASEEKALGPSLESYRLGDLSQALARYNGAAVAGASPAGETALNSADAQIYHAELLLSVGEVEEAEATLTSLEATNHTGRVDKLSLALRMLIAAVKRQASPATPDHDLATGLLGASYYQQSLALGDNSLRTALDLAKRAALISPRFGFAWARVAELEFSFGNTRAALEALEKARELSPRNAQALALNGFLLAAQNQTRLALQQFDQAIGADPALGNAWLGRGLCRIRLGHAREGREDFLVAAALEPQRAILRSYLGKAYADAPDDQRATHELEQARRLDPNDPTSWLYSALLKQQQNLINAAISDLEASQTNNDHRSLFRSRLLLDEDRAVGSANLASIYRDAGMTDVSVREAVKATTYDYANDSAHLFLADSYNDLRDPTRFNLRFETVWFNELLLANLLSPVGGGRLSQAVSQQEYSRLFEADGLHLANSTLARSDNKSVAELASQFGTWGSTSYSLDLDYVSQRGVRVNNDLSSIEWYSTIKQQITPQDTLLALVKYEDYHSGDNFQYYDPANARPNFRFDEYQHPIVVGAYHHEWSPAIHTLLLGGRLENEQHFSDLAAPQLVLIPTTPQSPAQFVPFDVKYQNQLVIYTAELNQILRWNRVTISAGARYQNGGFDTTSQLNNPGQLAFFFGQAATNAMSSSDDFERITGYGYLTVEPLDKIWLTGGLAYEDITYPLNFRHPPISSGEEHRSQLGPKAALVWELTPQATLRGAYSKSLGGVSLDESYRLEPTSLAGFPQSFRSLISESVVGSVSAPEYQTFGLALDLKFPSKTYAGIQADRLETGVRRAIGVFEPSVIDGAGFFPPFVPGSTDEHLDYRENVLSLTLNQLVGEEFVLGASYKYDQVELHDVLPAVSTTALPTADQTFHSDLHQVTGYALFNHRSGFFARADASWYHQNNSGYNPAEPGDDFVQENIYAGWRFWHRRAELMVGILNLSDQNYRLNPLTVYMELPRVRTYMVRLKFLF
jgi:Tfp pilus assembly protein PilF